MTITRTLADFSVQTSTGMTPAEVTKRGSALIMGFAGSVTATSGTFVAAAAAGRLIRRTCEQVISVVGVAASQACARYTHAALGKLLQLQQVFRWSADDIGLHRNGIPLISAPLDDRRRARTIVEGQLSMHSAAAGALLRGRFGWDDFELLRTRHDSPSVRRHFA